MACLEIEQGGGNNKKRSRGTEVLQLGPKAQLLWGLWGEAERFLESCACHSTVYTLKLGLF